MLVVCFHILAVKIYCLVVGFCDSQYFKALTLPAGHTVNFHENSNANWSLVFKRNGLILTNRMFA